MALMKRANREINVPENHVEEYLDKGYSLIDSHGIVLKVSNPQTIEDFRGLVVTLKNKITSLETEKSALLKEREIMLQRIEELKAEIESLHNVSTATAEPKKSSKVKET